MYLHWIGFRFDSTCRSQYSHMAAMGDATYTFYCWADHTKYSSLRVKVWKIIHLYSFATLSLKLYYKLR